MAASDFGFCSRIGAGQQVASPWLHQILDLANESCQAIILWEIIREIFQSASDRPLQVPPLAMNSAAYSERPYQARTYISYKRLPPQSTKLRFEKL